MKIRSSCSVAYLNLEGFWRYSVLSDIQPIKRSHVVCKGLVVLVEPLLLYIGFVNEDQSDESGKCDGEKCQVT